MNKQKEKTRRWLREALLALIQERPYEEISVQDITDRADTARVTLYRHYKNKAALLEDCLDHLFEELKGTLTLPQAESQLLLGQIIYKNAVACFEYLAKHRQLYRAILASSIGNYMHHQYRRLFMGYTLITFHSTHNINNLPVPMTLVENFITEAVTGFMMWWVQSDNNDDPQLLTEVMIRLVETGFFSLVGEPVTVPEMWQQRLNQ